ncbi:MAG: acyltransferase family protein [Tannerellaceae bacterium]|jgi:fucose 4-O-acetylase-like acetyltransferase|nr:acyltransferase family protein [Tannerellaceae bacterium]
MKRITYIEIARAVCIILVVVGHYIPEDSPAWYVTLHDAIYSFHMPLFMFVSGYVYRLSFRETIRYKEFVRKKFNRLMIPYFLVSLFVISIKLLTERDLHVENPVSLSSFYEIFYLPSAGAFLWFVYTLFFIFLIIPFFSTGKKLVFLFVASLILFILPVSFTRLFCMEYLRVNLVYFVLGCIMFQEIHARAAAEKISPVLLFMVFSVLFMIENLYPGSQSALISPFIHLGLAVSGIFLILYISRCLESKEGLFKRLFLGLSVYSYTIYLLHTTFEGLAKACLAGISVGLYWNNTFYFILQAIIVIASGLVIPVILHRAYHGIRAKIRFRTRLQ